MSNDVIERAREALEELRQTFEVDDSYLCLRSARAIENLADIVSELIDYHAVRVQSNQKSD